MKKVVGIVLLALIVASITIKIVAWRSYQQFLENSLDLPAGGLIIEVDRGDAITSVLRRLQKQGVTTYNWQWQVLLRLDQPVIRAGEFRLTPALRPRELLELLGSDRVVQYRFTIIEGWTWRQLQQALNEDPVLSALPANISPVEIMSRIGTESTSPEGWFLPETYAFVRGDSALGLLTRANEAMLKALDTAWSARRDDLPLKTPYELLTMASIVERESSLESERADIAGVFTRRLEQGWRLETDVSVIYGLGEQFDGDIRTRDLRTDTDYNTYTRRGLPPTPIAMPGVSSLMAAANPADGETMFFVASGTGGHVFSITLEEHNRAVRAYLNRTSNDQEN